MTVPLFPHRHDEEPVINGRGFVDAVGLSARDLPARAILGYTSSLVPLLRERNFTKTPGFPRLWGTVWLSPSEDTAVLEGFGIGAPAAAFVLEGIAALGVNSVISIGWAGALSREVSLGDIIVCTKALRDEGLSSHYLPPERYAHPDPSLTDNLADELEEHRAGPSWTTDAIFRETPTEVSLYGNEGVLTVEMEAAGLFAVAQYLHIALAAGFCISDHLARSQMWELSVNPTSQLALLLDAALRALGASSLERAH